MALQDKLVLVRNKNRRQELYGTANIMRPGLAPFVPPDARVEKNSEIYAKLHQKVWGYPMRLGVYFQHGPRPITQEKFPKLPVPQANGRRSLWSHRPTTAGSSSTAP